MSRFFTPKGWHVTARGETPGSPRNAKCRALKGRNWMTAMSLGSVSPLQGEVLGTWIGTRGVAPGCYMPPLQGEKSGSYIVSVSCPPSLALSRPGDRMVGSVLPTKNDSPLPPVAPHEPKIFVSLKPDAFETYKKRHLRYPKKR